MIEYEKPELEIVLIEAQDIITLESGLDPDDGMDFGDLF